MKFMLWKSLSIPLFNGVLFFAYVLAGVCVLLFTLFIVAVWALWRGLLDLYEIIDYTCTFLDRLITTLNLIATLVLLLPLNPFVTYTWWVGLAGLVAFMCILTLSWYLRELHIVLCTLRTCIKNYPHKSFLFCILKLPPKDHLTLIIGLGHLFYGFTCIIYLLF